MLNNLYKILEKTHNSFSLLLTNEEHEIFKAHFPSNPLLPGFILIDICEKEFEKKIKKIKKASFLKPILPNEKIDFFIQDKQNSLHVNIKNQNEISAIIIYEVF